MKLLLYFVENNKNDKIYFYEKIKHLRLLYLEKLYFSENLSTFSETLGDLRQ